MTTEPGNIKAALLERDDTIADGLQRVAEKTFKSIEEAEDLTGVYKHVAMVFRGRMLRPASDPPSADETGAHAVHAVDVAA